MKMPMGDAAASDRKRASLVRSASSMATRSVTLRVTTATPVMPRRASMMGDSAASCSLARPGIWMRTRVAIRSPRSARS
jgi:hypothetical protein